MSGYACRSYFSAAQKVHFQFNIEVAAMAQQAYDNLVIFFKRWWTLTVPVCIQLQEAQLLVAVANKKRG